MSKLTILMGLPALGKSTYVAANFDAANAFVYSTDNYIEKMAQERGTTYDALWSDNIKAATTAMNEDLVDAIREGKHVIWDQTNLTLKKRRSNMATFPKKYRKTCVCFEPPMSKDGWDEWERRIANRAGKNIPNFIRYNMMIQFQSPTFSEAFDEIIFCDMNGVVTSNTVR